MKLEPYKDWSDRVGEEFYYNRAGVQRLMRLDRVDTGKVYFHLHLITVDDIYDGFTGLALTTKIASTRLTAVG